MAGSSGDAHGVGAFEIEKAPGHERGCLYLSGGLCRCSRGDWLDATVTRAQARAELLTELAGWSHEQRIFAESYLSNDPETREPGMPGWRSAATRAAALMAQEVHLDVRRRALAQRDEVLARPRPELSTDDEPHTTAPHALPDDEMPDGRLVTTLAVQEALL